jgi:hypothetical protein
MSRIWKVSTLARFEASAKTDKVRRFKEFFDGAGSWSRVERIIARVEVGAQGADTRFIVTNLAGGKAKALYEDVYCRRGAAEVPAGVSSQTPLPMDQQAERRSVSTDLAVPDSDPARTTK